MRLLRMILLASALLATGSIVATAQNYGWQDRDRDHDRDWARNRQNNSAAYQQGWRDAQDDAHHGRNNVTRPDRYHNDRDRGDYQAGYSAGYQAAVNNGAYSNNGRWERRGNAPYYGNNYPYGNNGPYYSNGGYANGERVAQQNGYRDGVIEGQNDRATGHSFRPTEGHGYKLGTDGYLGQFGSRDQYKAWYRQAFEQGYSAGYNGNGYNPGYGYPRR